MVAMLQHASYLWWAKQQVSQLWRSAEWVSDSYIIDGNIELFVVVYVDYLADWTCDLLSIITPNLDQNENKP
jgi:hypothetical protein